MNVDDPHVDQAEAAVLRRDGDKSLLMAPLVYHDRVIGLVEIVDQKRSRHYSRQELRLCRAIAGQAAAALHNAKLFSAQARSDQDISSCASRFRSLTGQRAGGGIAAAGPAALGELARTICGALGAVSCVASCAGESAGAFGGGRPASSRATSVARAPRSSWRETRLRPPISRSP